MLDSAANRFASSVILSGGKLETFAGREAEVMAAITRFAAAVWPGKPIAPGRKYMLAKWLAKGVKYCGARQSDKYRIELGPSIFRGTAPAEVFDSQALYDRKIGPNRFFAGSVAGRKADWTDCRSIWVMTWTDGSQPVFYSHIGKLNRFHHSSFKAGGTVMAAGEWVIDHGVLKMLNACSGHYKPEPWRFAFAASYLKDAGIVRADTVVEVWKDGDRRLEPCLDFVAHFSARLKQGYRLYPP